MTLLLPGRKRLCKLGAYTAQQPSLSKPAPPPYTSPALQNLIDPQLMPVPTGNNSQRDKTKNCQGSTQNCQTHQLSGHTASQLHYMSPAPAHSSPTKEPVSGQTCQESIKSPPKSIPQNPLPCKKNTRKKTKMFPLPRRKRLCILGAFTVRHPNLSKTAPPPTHRWPHSRSWSRR